MKKDSKIAAVISSIMILFAVLLFIRALPYIYVWIAYGAEKNVQTEYLEKAVKYSVFPDQKAYTIEAIMPSLVLSGNFEDAIKYYEEYKKTNTDSIIKNAITHLAGYAYLHSERYADALEIAKELNDKTFLAQIYMKIGDVNTAKVLVNELVKENPEKVMNYRYLAEVQMGENKWKEAEISINKVLEFAPNNLDVLKDKVEISKQLGKTKEYKIYSKKVKEIEYKRNYR